jgi:hypothetical protein
MGKGEETATPANDDKPDEAQSRRDGGRTVALRTRSKITQAAGSAGETVASTVGPALAEAREKVGPMVEDAKERLGPVVEDAKDAIARGAEEAKEILAPVAAEALKATKKTGRKAAVKVGLAEEPKKSHKLRKLLVMLGIAGLAAFVYKKMTGRESAPQWTAPRDAAPSAPLRSDETVESPVPTTPDEPLEERSV